MPDSKKITTEKTVEGILNGFLYVLSGLNAWAIFWLIQRLWGATDIQAAMIVIVMEIGRVRRKLKDK